MNPTCPTCGLPITDPAPVVRPHATFCRACFEAVKGDNLATHDAAIGWGAATVAEPWTAIPGYPGYEIRGLSVRTWHKSGGRRGRVPLTAPKLLGGTQVGPSRIYRVRNEAGASVQRRAVDLHRLAYGKEPEHA